MNASGGLSDRSLQIYTSTVATRLVALASENVGKVHGTERFERPLAHSSINRVIRVRVEAKSVGIAAGRLVPFLFKSTLQALVHKSVLGREDIRVPPHDHVLLSRLGALHLGVQLMASAHVVVR